MKALRRACSFCTFSEWVNSICDPKSDDVPDGTGFTQAVHVAWWRDDALMAENAVADALLRRCCIWILTSIGRLEAGLACRRFVLCFGVGNASTARACRPSGRLTLARFTAARKCAQTLTSRAAAPFRDEKWPHAGSRVRETACVYADRP